MDIIRTLYYIQGALGDENIFAVLYVSLCYGPYHCYKTTVFYTFITVWTVVQAVLTATFNSYGDRQISFNPLQNQYPWTNRQKNRHSWLRPRGDPLYQIWYKSTHWGLLGKWVKYNKKLFFIYTFFSQARAQVRPVDGLLHAIAQKTWNHARMCLLGVWMMCP